MQCNPLVSGPLKNLSQTKSLAHALAAILKKGDTILLEGPLGSGKTTFTRFLLQHLIKKDVPVVSPTFTLMQLYETPKGNLWHVDLYRLKGLEPLELGLKDLWPNSIMFIEWPERLGEILPPQHLRIKISVDAQTGARFLFIEGTSGWVRRLKGVF